MDTNLVFVQIFTDAFYVAHSLHGPRKPLPLFILFIPARMHTPLEKTEENASKYTKNLMLRKDPYAF